MPTTERKSVGVLGFGDSLTAGTPGYDPTTGYGNQQSQYGYWLVRKAREARQLTLEFDNQGVPGELVRHMLQRLHSILTKHSYAIIVILGGSNDLGWGDEPDRVFGHLKDLWQYALDKGSDVIACTIPPVGMAYPPLQEAQFRFNDMIAEASREQDSVLLVDLFAALSNERGLLRAEFDSGDGLHMNEYGYRQMGESIWMEGIKRMLDSSRIR